MTTTEKEVTRTTDGDHDRFSHIIFGDNPEALITRAIVEGIPLKALCGKEWIPSRDPSNYPICPTCKEIKSQIMSRNE